MPESKQVPLALPSELISKADVFVTQVQAKIDAPSMVLDLPLYTMRLVREAFLAGSDQMFDGIVASAGSQPPTTPQSLSSQMKTWARPAFMCAEQVSVIEAKVTQLAKERDEHIAELGRIASELGLPAGSPHMVATAAELKSRIAALTAPERIDEQEHAGSAVLAWRHYHDVKDRLAAAEAEMVLLGDDVAREIALRIKDGEACNAAEAKWDGARKELEAHRDLLQSHVDRLTSSVRRLGEYVIDLRREVADAKQPIVLGPGRHKDIVPVLEQARVATRTALSRIDTNHGSFEPMVEVANLITGLFAALPGKQDSKGGST